MSINSVRCVVVRYFSNFNAARNKSKLLFCGTPRHSAVCLGILSDFCKSSNLCEIVGVCSSPLDTSHSRLSDVGIMAKKLDLSLFTPDQPGDKAFVAEISQLQPDLCITVSYGKYLPGSFLKIPTCGTVNIHPSLLPHYRGAAPVPKAILNGDSESGVTILYTGKQMDAGPIIFQEKVSLSGLEYSQDLIEQLLTQGMRSLCNADRILSILDKTCIPVFQVKQDYHQEARKLADPNPIDPKIITSDELYRVIRAYDGYFDITFEFRLVSGTEQESVVLIDKFALRVTRASLKPKSMIQKIGYPGQVIWVAGELLLNCSESSLNYVSLTTVGIAGQKLMSARDFYNGLSGKRNIKKLKMECHPML